VHLRKSWILIFVIVALVALGFPVWLKWQYETRRAVEQSAEQYSLSINREVADWTFGMLLAAIATFVASVGGLYWVAQSLNANRKANEISARAIFTAERAWVFTKPRQTNHLEFGEEESWSLDIVLAHTNVGNTAAIQVNTTAEVTFMDNELVVLERLKKANAQSNTERGWGTEVGIMLAPGETFERPWKIGAPAEEDMPPPPSTAGTADFLVGVIGYRTLFDHELHQTGFVFWIDKSKGEDDIQFKVWRGGFAS
jgi:hypothetical protein